MTDKKGKTSGGIKHKEKVRKIIEEYNKLPEEARNQLHIYYGYGKGKTTAAVGLIIRSLGAGRKAVMIQFDKGYDGKHEHYNERHLLRKLIELGYPFELYQTGCERMNEDGTFRFKNEKCDLEEAEKALALAKKFITEGDQKLLVLDEFIAAANYHLIKEKDVLDMIELYKANRRFELVITGHKLFDGLEEKADLITEMKKVKHYFDNGIQAREGIEY
jgi:cob(I)alamin adenosyltransferase